LAVATVDEGIELRQNGITVPILVLGNMYTGQLEDMLRYDLIVPLYSLKTAEYLSSMALRAGKKAIAHIKVNTGMNRLGVDIQDMVDFVQKVRGLQGIVIEGIYTHFASSAQADKSDANRQLEKFNSIIEILNNMNFKVPYYHAANSGAIMDMPYSYLTAVRPGRLVYGLYPYPEVNKTLKLKPALQLKCYISAVRKVSVGDGVGYNAQFCPSKPTTVLTLPLGSTDGISKRLSGKCPVLVRGSKKRIVAICADMCMVDLEMAESDIESGEEVTIIGNQGQESVAVDEIAEILGVTLGEVFCCLNKRLPRVYIKEGKPYLLRVQSGELINL
jgi:alanine racemase